MADWVRILNEAGIATFTMDSFTPRGILSLADVGRLNSLVRVVDAYRALALLSSHRLIDPDKIIVMGGSHGGTPALYSGMARFQRLAKLLVQAIRLGDPLPLFNRAHGTALRHPS